MGRLAISVFARLTPGPAGISLARRGLPDRQPHWGPRRRTFVSILGAPVAEVRTPPAGLGGSRSEFHPALGIETRHLETLYRNHSVSDKPCDMYCRKCCTDGKTVGLRRRQAPRRPPALRKLQAYFYRASRLPLRSNCVTGRRGANLAQRVPASQAAMRRFVS